MAHADPALNCAADGTPEWSPELSSAAGPSAGPETLLRTGSHPLSRPPLTACAGVELCLPGLPTGELVLHSHAHLSGMSPCPAHFRFFTPGTPHTCGIINQNTFQSGQIQ